MNDTLLRQLSMLRHVPRYPKKVDTTTLQDKLAEAGYDVTLRSIQRDLNTLSSTLPLISDNAKPQGWSWQLEADQLELPALDPQTALTFRLVENYLRPLLPATTLDYLKPWFQTAEGVLNAVDNNGFSSWPEKIRVLPNGQPLQAPQIDAFIQTVIYQALLQERRVFITYQARDSDCAEDRVINPLVLVVRDHLIYMVCTMWNYSNVLQLALHRIHSARMLDEPVTRPADFDIDAYIAEGKFSYLRGETSIALEAEFSSKTAHHLAECPLSDDQTLTDVGDNKVLVRATVHDTAELRWWLHGFGDGVTVLAPTFLRDEFAQKAKLLAERYAEASNAFDLEKKASWKPFAPI